MQHPVSREQSASAPPRLPARVLHRQRCPTTRSSRSQRAAWCYPAALLRFRAFFLVGYFFFFFSELPDLMSFPSCKHPGWAASEICHGEWEEEEGEPASACSVPGPCLLSIPSRGSPGLNRIGGAGCPQQMRKWSLWGFKFLPSHALVRRMSLQNAFPPGSQTGNQLRCGGSCLLRWRT